MLRDHMLRLQHRKNKMTASCLPHQH